MAIALDASSTGVVTGFNAAPGTTNITHVCTGSNLLLVLWVATFQDTGGVGTVSGATYNGVALTQAIASFRSVNVAGEMWYLAAPASGSHTLAVTMTGAVDGIRFEAASFTGVLQTSPLGVTNTATGASGAPAVAITSLTANSVLVSGLNRFANTATTSTTWTNIQRHNTTNVTTSQDYLVTTTAGAQTNTIGGTVTQDWSMGAAEFKPASSSVSASITQVAATLTATGGTQTVSATVIASASVTQVAATLTATGGTQAVVAKVATSVAQVAATLTATGGTQAVSTVNNVAITQSHATLTATGGTQTIASGVRATIAQLAATLTAAGGTQAVSSGALVNVAIAQLAAVLTILTGLQSIATSSNQFLYQTVDSDSAPTSVGSFGVSSDVDTDGSPTSITGFSTAQTSANLLGSEDVDSGGSSTVLK